MLRWIRSWGGLALAAAVGGCVFPSDEPTGIELSWRFTEVFPPAPGQDAGDEEDDEEDDEPDPRVRTCEGAGVQAVAFDIRDLEDETRQGSFNFECETGFQTQADFATESSDAFVQLKPGPYFVVFRTDEFPGEVLAEGEIEVRDGGLTTENFEVSRELVSWELRLSGLESCETFSLAVSYDDPEVQLADPPETQDGEIRDPVLYRANLRTDRGLSLAGEETACTADLTGVHQVGRVDPGRYRLRITVDGRECAGSVDAFSPTSTAIDLGAELPADLASVTCDG